VVTVHHWTVKEVQHLGDRLMSRGKFTFAEMVPKLRTLVVSERDGEEPASRHVSGGEQACLFAVRLLIDYRALRVGDRLTVREETDD
jgi:hypothetical protein